MINTIEELYNAIIRLQKNEERVNLEILLEEDVFFEETLIFAFSNTTITFLGAGAIIGDKFGRKVEKGQELTTWKTATMKISGDNNTFINLKVKNTAGTPHLKGQAVALQIFGKNNVFLNSYLDSGQDTLYHGALPQDLKLRYSNFLPASDLEATNSITPTHFFNSTIIGNIDFIFGTGEMVFDECRLIIRDYQGEYAYIAAPGHDYSCIRGFVFNHCTIEKEVDSNLLVYLARPWREKATAEFNDTIDPNKIVHEDRFAPWPNTTRHLTARFTEN